MQPPWAPDILKNILPDYLENTDRVELDFINKELRKRGIDYNQYQLRITIKRCLDQYETFRSAGRLYVRRVN